MKSTSKESKVQQEPQCSQQQRDRQGGEEREEAARDGNRESEPSSDRHATSDPVVEIRERIPRPESDIRAD